MWFKLNYYPGIYLKGLRKITNLLSQNNRFPDRNLNPGPSEHQAGVLTTQPRRSFNGSANFDISLLRRNAKI
jgi:hypothetical protein